MYVRFRDGTWALVIAKEENTKIGNFFIFTCNPNVLENIRLL